MECKCNPESASQYPNIAFTIEDMEYTIFSNDYILYDTDDGQGNCLVGITYVEGTMYNSSIFGDVFIRKFTTIYDKANNRIGLAVN